MKPDPYDQYSLDLFCQHCGHYLTTLVGIEREGGSGVYGVGGMVATGSFGLPAAKMICQLPPGQVARRA